MKINPLHKNGAGERPSTPGDAASESADHTSATTPAVGTPDPQRRRVHHPDKAPAKK